MTKGIKRYFKDNLGIIAALVIMILFLYLFPRTHTTFLTKNNIFNVLRQSSTNLMLACGMTMVIILGGIDLSVGSIIAMSGVLGAAAVVWHGMPEVVGILIAILSGAWKFLGAGYVGGIPTPVITMFIVFVVAVLFLNRTRIGRHIYAVGGSDTAAKFSGISTAKVKFVVFSFSGLMAGLAGITIASRLYAGTCTSGDGAEMDAIAAVVVGGTSMSGGSGKLGGTLIGVLIIGILNNGLNLMGVNSDWQYIIKGAVILLAVYTDFLRNRKKAA